MQETLIRPLWPGPIDLVGDVHGELEALERLLAHLGYNESGQHPQGRRLIFLGDLVDRGPDSPGVVRRVRDLVEAERAQCILGNHEFNILRGAVKPDNHWFFDAGPQFRHDGTLLFVRHAEPSERLSFLSFFASLPLALVRDDVRVVHACWEPSMVEALKAERHLLALYWQYHDALADALTLAGADEITRILTQQNQNPIKRLTSGLEGQAEAGWTLNGSVRRERRLPWWEGYADRELCVFGHYWRVTLPGEEGIEGLFTGRALHETLGPGGAMCIDYSVGKRFRERLTDGFAGTYHTRLAALRLPERVLVDDCGAMRGLKGAPR